MSAPRSMVPFGGIHSPAPGLLNLGLPAWLRSGPGAPQCPRVLSLGSSHISHGFWGTVPVAARILRGAIHPSGFGGRRGRPCCFPAAPRAREPATKPSQEHCWGVRGAPPGSGPLLDPSRAPLEGRLCSGLQQVIGDAAYSEFIKGPPFPRTVMQRPAWLSFFSVRGKKKRHPQTSVSGPHQAWVTPTESSNSGFLSQRAAPQVSLTKATPQGAPETGAEEVLHQGGR